MPTDSPASAPLWIERRHAVRFPVNDEAQIELLTEPSFKMPGFLRDASGTGLRLALPERLSMGTAVRITLTTGSVLHGEIRYCRSAGNAFYAGVLLRPALAALAA